MRVFSLIAIITLVATVSVPALAEWTEAMAAEPVQVLEMATEAAPPPVEVLEQGSADIAQAAQQAQAPAPIVYNTQNPGVAVIETALPTSSTPAPVVTVSYPTEEPPSYMKVYEPEEPFKPYVFAYGQPGVVPEPSSIIALSTGVCGLLFKFGRRRK